MNIGQPKTSWLKVIGLGQAGASMVLRIRELPGGDIVENAVVDCDQRTLAGVANVPVLYVGQSVTRGGSAGGDLGQGRMALDADAALMKTVCSDARIVCIVFGLGGGFGSGAAPSLARLAREQGALVLVVVTTPFDFEGRLRRQIADVTLNELRGVADAVICLPTDRLQKMLGDRVSAQAAFRSAAEQVGLVVRHLSRMLNSPGARPLDFAHLETMLRGHTVENVFAAAEAEGSDRVKQVLTSLLHSPFLDEGRALGTASSALLSIVAGENITLAELNELTRELESRIPAEAQLTIGTAVDDSLGDRLQVMLLAARKLGKQSLSTPTPLAEAPTASSGVSSIHRGDPKTASKSSEELLGLLESGSSERSSELPLPTSPPLAPSEKASAYERQRTANKRTRKRTDNQPELALYAVPQGRFANTAATVHNNENLDIPTWQRRGLSLN